MQKCVKVIISNFVFFVVVGIFFVIHERVMGTLRVKKPEFFKMSPYTLF